MDINLPAVALYEDNRYFRDFNVILILFFNNLLEFQEGQILRLDVVDER